MKIRIYTQTVISVLIVIFLINITTSCIKEDEKELDLPFDEEQSDFELINDETEGILLAAAEVYPNTTKINNGSTRAKIVNRCIDVWQKMDTTKYVHSKNKVINEKEGVFKYDCSGFVGRIVVKEVLKNHYTNLVENTNPIIDINGIEYMNVIRPLAGTMYDYFRYEILRDKTTAQNKYWKVFMSVDSLKRGDFIVARYSDDWRIDNNNKTTGHIMIAWEIGTVNANNEVRIQVMDATSSAHTQTADTRTMNLRPVAELLDGKKSGIGFGKMIYKISTNGHKRPYAYKWSLNSKYYYNLMSGDNISEPESDKYDRLKGVVFVRPI